MQGLIHENMHSSNRNIKDQTILNIQVPNRGQNYTLGHDDAQLLENKNFLLFKYIF